MACSRINVSVDTLDAAKFKAITRWGDLAKVQGRHQRPHRLAGLAIKINAVALKGVNEQEIPDMIRWAHGEGMDLTLIETMPLGRYRRRPHRPVSAAVGGAGHADGPDSRWRTFPTRPADRRAMCSVKETGGRLGFITPLTHNFCESCNRVRLTCTGTLYMCLGQEDAADLRAPLRASEGNDLLNAAIDEAISPQAQGPRLHHRPPPQQARGVAAHECDRRMTVNMFGPLLFLLSRHRSALRTQNC